MHYVDKVKDLIHAALVYRKEHSQSLDFDHSVRVQPKFAKLLASIPLFSSNGSLSSDLCLIFLRFFSEEGNDSFRSPSWCLQKEET